MDVLTLDFLAVGPRRTGTSWLYEALRRTPGVFVSPVVKESRFFDENWTNGPEWFDALFKARMPEDLVGEIGSSYFDSDLVRTRIGSHSPDAKILITLRNPLDRVRSLQGLLERTGQLPTGVGLREAITLAPELVTSSRYAHHCEEWLRRFGGSQVAVVFFDDLVADPGRFYHAVLSLLGMPGRDLPEHLREAFVSCYHNLK